MRRNAAFWIGFALCGSLGVAAGEIAKRDFGAEPVSDVIFPPQQIPLRFDHELHLTKVKLECDFCHEDVSDSQSSLDTLLPAEEQCEFCHAIDRDEPNKQVEAGKPPAHCESCHPGYDETGQVPRIVIPPPNLKFDHAAHVGRDIACSVCHGDLAAEKVGVATRAQLPKMGLCLQCHDGARAASECTTCHLAAGNGRIETQYASGELKPSGALRGAAHTPLFRTQHADVAKTDPAYCETCHTRDYCVGCHNGVVKPLDFHGNDYVTLHAIDARRNQPDCSACHRQQTFCVGCHSRTGVAFDGKGSEFRDPLTGTLGARFHPEGWAAFDGRGPNHHAFQAQRNIRQCASCHRETFCTTCHSAEPTNAFRINPHPAGWIGSSRCKALAARAGRMCLRCHIDPNEARCE